MSCFIVRETTIGRVVEAASHTPPSRSEPFGKAFINLGYNLPNPEDRELLARALFDLNVKAFCERYPADEESAYATRYPEDIPESFDYVPAGVANSRADLIQAHKSASCLSYQCGEGDVPENPLYKALEELCDTLAGYLVITSSEWEVALWE
ncbi:MAG: hypothetical protein EBY32_14305 [Proteobacteria bacterium]|nr:hypothetical protein [Pseudomonadota bacterium]